MNEPKTLGELKKSGRQVLTVRQEMRKNLVQCLQTSKRILPGILGYDDTVIPDIENAVVVPGRVVAAELDFEATETVPLNPIL